jgi:hypothetical protein
MYFHKKKRNCCKRALSALGLLLTTPWNGLGDKTIKDLLAYKTIFKIKSNAVGLDEIPIKKIPVHNNLHITYIFISSIFFGTFPTAWKNCKTIPIHKIADPHTIIFL